MKKLPKCNNYDTECLACVIEEINGEEIPRCTGLSQTYPEGVECPFFRSEFDADFLNWKIEAVKKVKEKQKQLKGDLKLTNEELEEL